jgi:hypothetical protein
MNRRSFIKRLSATAACLALPFKSFIETENAIGQVEKTIPPNTFKNTHLVNKMFRDAFKKSVEERSQVGDHFANIKGEETTVTIKRPVIFNETNTM